MLLKFSNQTTHAIQMCITRSFHRLNIYILYISTFNNNKINHQKCCLVIVPFLKSLQQKCWASAQKNKNKTPPSHPACSPGNRLNVPSLSYHWVFRCFGHFFLSNIGFPVLSYPSRNHFVFYVLRTLPSSPPTMLRSLNKKLSYFLHDLFLVH